jgi:hypothetical protein
MVKQQNPANLGKKWTIEEENTLLQELYDDIDIELIAQAHKRTRCAISSRKRLIAYNMYLANTPEEEIFRKTKINKEQLVKIIAKKEKASKNESLIKEAIEMSKEIRELKNSLKNLSKM